MKIRRLSALFLAVVFILCIFVSCKKNTDKTDASSTESSIKPNIKPTIDALYTSGYQKDLEQVCISQGRSYESTGDEKENSKTLLTDNVYAGEKSSDTGWAVFSCSSSISITVNLGKTVERISSFAANMLYIPKEAIFLPDEITVLASTDGQEFVPVGTMQKATTGTISRYQLVLQGSVKASHIRFVPKSNKNGSIYIDELSIYEYGEKKEEKELFTYTPFYNSKMPEPVTEQVTWSENEADYNTVQNLIKGKKASIFTMRTDVAAGNNSPIEDITKITDGKYNTTNTYNDEAVFSCSSPLAFTDARLFVFDLEKTSAINGFAITFFKDLSADVSLPVSVSVYASENGKAWDVCWRRDDIRASRQSESKTVVSLKETFERCRTRFVAVFFDVESIIRFDEIEIFGTKSIKNARAVSEKGDSKFFTGEYPVPEDYKGLKNLMLMYHCYSSKVKDSTPVVGDYNYNHCLKLAGYNDQNGKITDYYFDSFIFLPGGDTVTWNKAFMWKVYFDNLFSKDYNLDALNKAATQVGSTLGDSNYKAKIILTILLPSKNYTDFGDLDGDGKDEDLNTLEGKQKVIDWQINQYLTRFKEQNYSNLELVGFYWHDEVIRYDDLSLCAAIRYTAQKAHENNLLAIACPYYIAMGYYDWYTLGFDLVFYQPSYYWKKDVNRITHTVTAAKEIGMGVEMEVESDVTKEFDKLMVYAKYLQFGVDYGYMDNIHMFYYANPFCGSCDTKTQLGRQLYDLTYQFVKGTLAFSVKDIVYDKVFTCKAGEKISENLDIKSLNATLAVYPKYGSVKINNTGDFTYTPYEGFAGEDSFIIEAVISGNETVKYEVKIKVES
jgi:hypothetical protein